MLKTLVNEAQLRLNITTTGPLLIKSGYATVSGAAMTPVQTYRNGQQEVYLPGSSLKGVFRSHLEKVVNSIKPCVACDPLSQSGDTRRDDGAQLYRTSCGKRIEERSSSHEKYANSCPTCRLFGSTSFIGRISIDDAYLPYGSVGTEALVERRDSVAIDRLTGGASGGAKFDMEVVTTGTTFHTTIHLRNFEIWQLGMLFIIIQDMEDELIRIGSGRSRGLGKIVATISEQEEGSHPGGVVLSTIRKAQRNEQQEQDYELWGLGRWLDDETTYGTKHDDVLQLSQAIAHIHQGIRSKRVFKDEALNDLKVRSIEYFVAIMQQWPNGPEEAAMRHCKGGD